MRLAQFKITNDSGEYEEGELFVSRQPKAMNDTGWLAHVDYDFTNLKVGEELVFLSENSDKSPFYIKDITKVVVRDEEAYIEAQGKKYIVSVL